MTNGLEVYLDASLAQGTSPYSTSACASGAKNFAWTDLSGQSNTATLAGFAPSCSATDGWNGSGTTSAPYALAFNGQRSYIGVTWPTTNDLTTAVQSEDATFCAWINLASIPTETGVVGIGDSGSHGFNLAIVNGRANLVYGGVANVQDPSTLSAGQWYYLCGVGRPNHSLNLYTNAALTTSGSSNIGSYTITPVGGVLVIGNEGQLASGRYFPGSIAEVEVYSRGLTATEITKNCSALSSRFSGVTCAVNPEAPTNVSATAVSTTQIDLNWTASVSSGVTGYTIQRSTDGVNYSTVTTVGSVTTYSNTSLSSATRYYYQISAATAASSSSYSTPVSATTN